MSLPHGRRRSWHLRCLGLGLLLATSTPSAQARSFQAEGADTGAGLGARYVALGGAGVTTSDDVYAIYYNPAGLAQVQGVDVSVSRQLNARLHEINFLGVAWRLPRAPSWGANVTVAAAYYPRIHARASGAFGESDFESIFLRYLLPGIAGTFDGDVDTKTKSYRLAVGVAPSASAAWSVGFYVERIDCKSTFCGVHATSNGFTTQSTGATATGSGVGIRFRPTPEWTLAASISELHTRLTLNTVTNDNAGTRERQTRAEFPRKIALGAARHFADEVMLAAEVEVTRGRYGDNDIDLRIARLGVEKLARPWVYRAGAVVPIKIESRTTGEVKLPSGFAPSVGLGWRSGGLAIDFALYAHPVMSLDKGTANPAADLSLSLCF